MTENENTRLDVVVALIMNAERQCLWIWNEAWGAFALPMTKRRSGTGLDELPARAAARAGAEALGVPVRVGAHWAAIPEPKVSERDLALRTYAYEVFRVDPHPKFADALLVRSPHVWLTTDEAFSGDFQPLSGASLEVLARVIEQGRLPARTQHTSALILRRDDREEPRFLLRWNEHWGYALPSGRRASQDDPLETAQRVALKELGLTPGRDVTLTRARVETLTTHAQSPSADLPTYYLHALFNGTLGPDARLSSSEPLIWASQTEILQGETKVPDAVPGTPAARPGPISRTAFQLLAAADDRPWIDASLFVRV
jgi:hypothetical protein